jgi:type IV pilus assembly protein PilN
MIRINLLPVRETKKQARLRVQAVWLGAAAGAGVVVSIFVHLVVAQQAAEKRAQIQQANAELVKLEETRKEVDRFKAEEEEISRKLMVIDQLETARRGNMRLMDELATRIPERMWLTTLSLEATQLKIEGISIDAEIVAQFLSGLEVAPDFRNVELEETSVGEYQGLKLNKFKVRASYGVPPPVIGPAKGAAAKGAGAGKAPAPKGK